MANYEEYVQINRELWNAKTPVHVDSEFYDMASFRKSGNSLKHIELEELPDINGKKILHLQCHFGQDSISLANLGGCVTAIDLSPVAIEKAKELSKELGTEVTFIESNVYDVSGTVQGQFDLVFASYGTICWLDNLDDWAKVIADKLKPGGQFYFIEFHPFIDALDDNYLAFGYPYFNESAIKSQTSGTYADQQADIGVKGYFWNHPISEVINALTSNGLQLNFFNEYPYTTWPCFPKLKKIDDEKWAFEHLNSVPMLYSLLATKV